MSENLFSIDTLLEQMVAHNASDLHLTVGSHPALRVRGGLERLEGFPVLTADMTRELLYRIISSEQQKRLEIERQIDLSYSIPGLARFRVNIYSQRESLAGAFRLIPAELKSLEELGLPSSLYRLCEKPRGLVLVTGPTGSGKTTTLYASLAGVDTATTNVLTVEDPVEYELAGIGQTQVNSKIDLTFAKALRAILRQDPDVIMIGEIRDFETAQIAVQASLTGHLVLATLHTNDAPSAVTRLTDMGIEPFLLSSSLLGVLAQRLVRKLCPECKVQDGKGQWHPVGCSECGNSGYKGRTGVYELMVADDRVRALIHNRAPESELIATARLAGMRSMREDGDRLVAEGVTSPEEVLRVTRE